MDESTDLDQLIEEGHQLREAGEADRAYATFLRVWDAANAHGDDWRAFTAAHMLGVIDRRWEEKLRWHLASLDRANAITDGRVVGVYPSVYVNLGYVVAHLGRLDEALTYYHRAEACQDVLPDDDYGRLIRGAITRGLTQLSRGEAPTPE